MKNQKILRLLGIFTILLLGCSTFSRANNNNTNEIKESLNTGPTIVLEDDFSSSSSGWPSGEDEYSSSYYINDGYEISIFLEDYISWVYMSDFYENLIIEVDATFTGGGDDNSFGIICRHADENNYYVFVISADGYMGIGKSIDGGDITIIGSENFEPSDAINVGYETNRIKASCIDDLLTLWVNGILVAEVQDSSLFSGTYGLFASTFSAQETSVSFDNLTVSKP